jgi:protein SCO1
MRNAFAGLVVCAIALSFSVQAQNPGQDSHGRSHSPPEGASAKPLTVPKLSLPDVQVLDQNGRKQNFYTDLVKNKTVVINLVFTTCKAMCPLLGANFSKLQTALGDRLGKDVFLISVSTDPETDSPEKFKAWGEKFKAKSGWTLVTGENEELTPLLQVLSGDGPQKGYHAPSLCIFNDKTKTYRWAYGLEAPERVIQIVDELARQR